MKKVFEPVSKSIKDASEELTKTITETSNNNSKALENINNKFPEIMDNRGIKASYLLSPLAKITSPENSTQFNLIKDSSSNTVKDLLIHNTKPITIHDNLLTFRDTNKQFELKGDLLKMVTKKSYKVGLAILSDKKLRYSFAKEMSFDTKTQGKKSTRDRNLKKVFKSPGIVVSASGISTTFLSSNANEICDRLKNNMTTKTSS